jgi:hypothetical protein
MHPRARSASLGNALEWFDWNAYAVFAGDGEHL